MNKIIGFLQYGLAALLYVLSAISFVSFLYAITIRDTVSAIESAFGTFVIIIAMLVMAKFSRDAARKRLADEPGVPEEAEKRSDDHPGE